MDADVGNMGRFRVKVTCFLTALSLVIYFNKATSADPNFGHLAGMAVELQAAPLLIIIACGLAICRNDYSNPTSHPFVGPQKKSCHLTALQIL